MSEKWTVEMGDEYGLDAVRVGDHSTSHLGIPPASTHASEAEALAYGLECLVSRREMISASIKDARRQLRRLYRKNPSDKEPSA